jgi:hypothetical protein
MKTVKINSLVMISILLMGTTVYPEQDYSSNLEVLLDPAFHCAADHLHIPGKVENRSDKTIGKVKVEGRAYDENGNIISSTTSWVMSDSILPGKSSQFNLEFLDITGPVHDKVKNYDVKVIEVQ